MKFYAPISPPVVLLPSTQQIVQNTTSETTLVEWTIPANTLRSKSVLDIYIPRRNRNFFGSNQNVTYRHYVNSSLIGSTTTAMTNSGTIFYKVSRSVITNNTSLPLFTFSQLTRDMIEMYMSVNNSGTTSTYSTSGTAIDITATITISFTIQLAVASTSFYIEPYNSFIAVYNGY